MNLEAVNIRSEEDAAGFVPDPRGCAGFKAIAYNEGGHSYIPDNFFRSWQDHTTAPGELHIGRCSSFGVDSSIRYSIPGQTVKVGRYVTAGLRTRIIPSDNHETRAISTCQFSAFDKEMLNPLSVEYGDIIIKNDIWIGDEAMILADSIIENGCIIGARSLIPLHFRSEPFGIYAGSPAKLRKFRFSEKVRELLLDIAWWDMPFAWVKQNNDYFLHDLTLDNAVDILQELKAKKEAYVG